MAATKADYPATLDIDYPDQLDRTSTFFRIILAIPILIILSLLSGEGDTIKLYVDEAGKTISQQGTGIAGGLFVATMLMILFRQRYPRWWFNFQLELNRFSTRVCAYLLLLTDKYPSTEDEQSIHLNLVYPNAKKDLNSALPLFKWFLVIPHYIILIFLSIGVLFVTIIAWFSILFTGQYPKSLFNYVVGVFRWGLRVSAYAFLLTTDIYPPFELN